MTRSCSCGFQDYLCCCKSPEYEPLQWGTGQTLVKILFPIISWKELCNMVQFIRKKKTGIISNESFVFSNSR